MLACLPPYFGSCKHTADRTAIDCTPCGSLRGSQEKLSDPLSQSDTHQFLKSLAVSPACDVMGLKLPGETEFNFEGTSSGSEKG